MARTKFKWKLALFSYLILVNVCIKSLPISARSSLINSDSDFKHQDFSDIQDAVNDLKTRAAAIIEHEELVSRADLPTVDNSTEIPDASFTEAINRTRNGLMRNIRPGQEIRQYALELTVNGNTFSGRAVIDVVLEFATREDPIELHVHGLTIQSVLAGVFTDANAVQADFNVDDDILEIEPAIVASSYILIIQYTGSLTTAGQGFYRGQFNDFNYLAMNLHPTHARRVFPCMDEPTEASIISFTFNGIDYNHLMANSLLEDNSANQFRALPGPPHLWSMAAHNLNNINVPTTGVFLYIRPGVSNQESQAAVALNFYYNTLNEWTLKPYFEIIVNQANQLSILSLPDVSREWYGLSTVGIWEPHVLMEQRCSAKQRYTGLSKMAEALSRQWFGQVIYPENWRFEWVVSGLAKYAAFDILREFQVDTTGIDISLLDINTLFVTEVIQEALYHDGYATAHALEAPRDNIFDEDEIRDYIYDIHKYKAPALFRMLRLTLGEDQDFIRQAGRALLAVRSLQTVNTMDLVDAINSDWIHNGNDNIDDIGEYLEPWLENNGAPVISVWLTPTGVLVIVERFGFSTTSNVPFNVPITFSVSTNHNFNVINPIEMMDETTRTFPMFLDEDEGDYVLFNVQGQGYYRVNYDVALWERIIEALGDPDRRAEIHPLNRATLVDDALNLARAGRIDYEIAFEVVLTMEHETEYAPWKAFVRNMNFIRKRLVAMVSDDDDLDPDIYLRMVRRTIVTFEEEIGFDPDPLITEPAMTSLTRGLVMDHACRAGYQPCVAAAVDWFYDDNNNEVVNPNIPNDIRPAVYCTMVREGGDDVVNALYARLEIEVSMWERVVILESLACSTNNAFVRTYLEETIASNSPYTTEERLKIFIAVAESSWENAFIAFNFMSMRVNEIRNTYGGDAKLEEAINALSENMADWELSNNLFNVWVFAQNNNLEDSQLLAERAAARVMEDVQWDDRHRDYVYEWIDENDAPTLVVSLILISISGIIALFNH